jgi:dCTP deaminase
MIIPAQTLRKIKPVYPFLERGRLYGMSYGLSAAGYDIRVAQDKWLGPGQFALLSSLEHFRMPTDVLGVVHDKSTLARLGLALQNTIIEPGWSGFLTLEVTNHSWGLRRIRAGQPIAQIIFHRLEEPTEEPYAGKYQNQKFGPQPAILENTR